jgi:hypothetical protein
MAVELDTTLDETRSKCDQTKICSYFSRDWRAGGSLCPKVWKNQQGILFCLIGWATWERAIERRFEMRVALRRVRQVGEHHDQFERQPTRYLLSRTRLNQLPHWTCASECATQFRPAVDLLTGRLIQEKEAANRV